MAEPSKIPRYELDVLQPEPGQVVYYPIIDGMAEFKLNVNAYSPEYGRSSGGTVMVIGKSGGNQFHGSLCHRSEGRKFGPHARRFATPLST